MIKINTVLKLNPPPRFGAGEAVFNDVSVFREASSNPGTSDSALRDTPPRGLGEQH